MDLAALVEQGLRGEGACFREALEILRSSDDELLDLVAAAGRVRRRFFGNRVKVNYLVSLKSGLCPEDCAYCSQAKGSAADVLTYSWLDVQQAVAAARAGLAGGASRVCLVASGRGPSDRDVERVGQIVGAIKSEAPEAEICACLGLLRDGQAQRLKDVGVDAYNHNLNTAESHYEQICATHTYADRVETVGRAHDAGLSACSGLVAGMGESEAQLLEVVFALRDSGADSIPVNFLLAFDGTPLAGATAPDPRQCLRILAMVRFVCPDREVRVAAGREAHLRTLQPLALHIANSIFLGDYLTSEGAAGAADLAMIADAGFVVEGCVGDPGDGSAHSNVEGPGVGVPPRRRGAGTAVPANA